MELKWMSLYFFCVVLLWLWVINDKLKGILECLEILARPHLKQEISEMTDDLFTKEYDRYREEALRRMK